MERHKAVNLKLSSDRKQDVLELLRAKSDLGSFLPDPNALIDIVERERVIPLPDVLYEQYDFLQCRCFLGLFPEINRAWITIDHQLFLWNYNSPEEFEVFDEQEQVIVSVGLVKPLPGVFLNEINYLLVVATPIEIILVAVAYNESKALNLYRTEISIASDNISMTSIVGADNGRIFMCGSNGRLYELQYQAEDGWFTRKCRKVDLTTSAYSIFVPTIFNFAEEDPIRKIVVDQARNTLFALTERSNIELFYLGPEGKDFKKLFKYADVFSQAQRWLEGSGVYPHPYLDPRNFQIISIHVIPPSDSSLVHLMAISSSGYRLYYSTFSSQKNEFYGVPKTSPQVPTIIELVHVQAPPQNGDRLRLHESCYYNGTLLAANAINDESDSITCFSFERTSGSELFGVERIDGKTWGICESVPKGKIPSPSEDYIVDSTYVKRNIVLTNAGIIVLKTRRPIDILVSILENTYSTNSWPPSVGLFRTWFTAEQTCAMCLAIMCSREYAGTNISRCAENLFFLVGGKPTVRPENEQQRIILENSTLGRPLPTNEYLFSGRHEGLVLYFSRLLQPLWKSSLVEKTKAGTLGWKPSHILLGAVFESLSVVDRLLTTHSSLTSDPSPNDTQYSIGNLETPVEKEAWQEEMVSMKALHVLIQTTLEGISFVLLLQDVKFLNLSATFEDRLLKYLLEESFESLITLNIGKDIGKQIFSKIIQAQISQNLEIAEICELAQTKCPRFCCVEDVLLYKGMEALSKAKSEDGHLGLKLLEESLEHFLNILPTLTFEKVSELVGAYQSVYSYGNAIKLALSFSQAADPNSVAFSYFVDGQPANDYREVFFQKRQECYQLVKSLILSVQVPSGDAAEIEGDVNEIQAGLVDLGLQYEDKLFHYFIFDWFMTAGMTDRLLELNSAHLEEFLGMEPIAFERIDLLWKLYVRNAAFMKAAHVLYAMAIAKIYPLPFIKRLELLQLAATNAKSATIAQGEQAFMRELEDKKDVALIQMEVIAAVSKMGAPFQKDSMLFESLLSISDLYTHYARVYNLHEICLLIFFTAEHREGNIVSQTWVKLIKEILDSNVNDAEKLLTLEEKLRSLGAKYLADDHIFPLAFLCTHLETILFQSPSLAAAAGAGTGDSWVVNVMLSVGVSINKLFEIYNEMFETRSSPWNVSAGEQYLAARLGFLIGRWCESVEVSLAERMRFPAKNVDDALSKLLFVSGGHSHQQGVLKALQDRIRRSFL